MATVLLAVVWLVQPQTRDASPVDVAWTASLGLMGVLYAVTRRRPSFASHWH